MTALKWAVSLTLLAAAVLIVGYNYNISDVLADTHKLSVAAIAAIFAMLLANILAAVFRFKVVSADIGHPISLRRAGAAVSAGNLAGAVFFQIAGQLMARSVVMARAGIPFASVVVVTGYERIVAAIVSGLLALAGAYFIFGNVLLDQNAGGGELLKIMAGLIAATTSGALLGYGRTAARTIVPFMTKNFAQQCLRLIGLTILVQFPIMAAYVTAAHMLSPQTSLASLIAASAIVMFAASVPISLAGWGVREMSAVVALGAIGVEAHDAILAAVIVGAGSMIATAVYAAIFLPRSIGEPHSDAQSNTAPPINYTRALGWVLPIAAAMLVFFQIYVPIGSGTLLNVNLADPIAILGSVLFVVTQAQSHAFPQWRFLHLNGVLAAITLIFTASLLIGAARFGWTNWALINRYCGWYVLVAYSGSGALILRSGGKAALRILLLTFAGAGASIAAIELLLLLLNDVGLRSSLPIMLGGVDGFSQNHNFFAFQLLMTLAATLVAVSGRALRITLLTLIIAAIYFTGSRSGWITLPFILLAGLYTRSATAREIGTAIVCATAVVLIIIAAAVPFGQMQPYMSPDVATNNTDERLLSILGGLHLFSGHPIFGAGLGAFRNLLIMRYGGQPLLIHSTYVWLLAEMGTVGLIAFCVPALYILYAEIRRSDADIAGKLIVMSFVGFGIMSLPADMLYQRTFWLLVGVALAAKAIVGEMQATVPDRATTANENLAIAA